MPGLGQGPRDTDCRSIASIIKALTDWWGEIQKPINRNIKNDAGCSVGTEVLGRGKEEQPVSSLLLVLDEIYHWYALCHTEIDPSASGIIHASRKKGSDTKMCPCPTSSVLSADSPILGGKTNWNPSDYFSLSLKNNFTWNTFRH